MKILSDIKAYGIFLNVRNKYFKEHLAADGVDRGGHTMDTAQFEGCRALVKAQAEVTRDEILTDSTKKGLEHDYREYCNETPIKLFTAFDLTDGLVPDSGPIEYPYLPFLRDTIEQIKWHSYKWRYWPGIECVSEFKSVDDGIYREFVFADNRGWRMTMSFNHSWSFHEIVKELSLYQRMGYRQIG
jgi:hypothetical protein